MNSLTALRSEMDKDDEPILHKVLCNNYANPSATIQIVSEDDPLEIRSAEDVRKESWDMSSKLNVPSLNRIIREIDSTSKRGDFAFTIYSSDVTLNDPLRNVLNGKGYKIKEYGPFLEISW